MNIIFFATIVCFQLKQLCEVYLVLLIHYGLNLLFKLMESPSVLIISLGYNY